MKGYKHGLYRKFMRDAAKTQLVYQKISGRVKKIPFCEA